MKIPVPEQYKEIFENIFCDKKDNDIHYRVCMENYQRMEEARDYIARSAFAIDEEAHRKYKSMSEADKNRYREVIKQAYESLPLDEFLGQWVMTHFAKAHYFGLSCAEMLTYIYEFKTPYHEQEAKKLYHEKVIMEATQKDVISKLKEETEGMYPEKKTAQEIRTEFYKSDSL